MYAAFISAKGIDAEIIATPLHAAELIRNNNMTIIWKWWKNVSTQSITFWLLSKLAGKQIFQIFDIRI